MLKKAAKEQEADATLGANTTSTTGGDVTINVPAGLNRRSLLNELESKIGEMEKIKDKEQASNDDDQETGSSDANFEPAEKGSLFIYSQQLMNNLIFIIY